VPVGIGRDASREETRYRVAVNRVSSAQMPAGFRRFRRRSDHPVAAVRLLLDTDGFTYRKWGGEQRCKPGDWLVDNAGDIYTVDADVFARTYRASGPGQYVKVVPVLARIAEAPGAIATREGLSHYQRGDYIVSNHEDGTDAYCMTAAKFDSLYEPDD
jgi:hypothetical protein